MIDTLKQNCDIWNQFTKKEEYNPQIVDKYGRCIYPFSGYHTLCYPAVSKYLIDSGYTIEYPEEKDFAVCLTHDIDLLYEPLLSKIGGTIRLFGEQQWREAIKKAHTVMKRKDPWCNFESMVAIEEKYDARSTFFVLALNENDEDYAYNIEDIELELTYLIDKDFEVGLHGGHRAYSDSFLIESEKKSLEKVIKRKVVGYRNHYLRFNVPDTWEYLTASGFGYDSSYGYAHNVGFRNGMCHPFMPYNLNTDSLIDIIELPLIVMDQTLDTYLRLDTSNAWGIIKQLIDATRQNQGVLTILWHNTSMFSKNLALYEKILQYCHSQNAWQTHGRDIMEWWKRKGFSHSST